MPKVAGFLAAVCLMLFTADAQEHFIVQGAVLHPKSPLASDTIPLRSRPFFMLPLSFGLTPHYRPEIIHTIPVLHEPFFLTLTKEIDISSPWKLELAEQNEFRTLGLILGSIEAGGAAYIAYRHIKKYGIF